MEGRKIFRPPLASCLLPLASCLLPLASCLLPLAFYSLFPVPVFPVPFFCLLPSVVS